MFNAVLFSFFLFSIGLFGILLNRQNLILILLSIELILLSVNLNFIFFSIFLDDILGQIFALMILTVAAAESAIGLAIILAFFRLRGTISVSKLNQLSI